MGEQRGWLTLVLFSLCLTLAASSEGQTLQALDHFHGPVPAGYSPDPKFDARVSHLLSRNILQLAKELGTSLLETSTEKTEVFSPLSIYGALSLLLLGSAGRTHQELMHLLKFDEGEIRRFVLQRANETLPFSRYFLGQKPMEDS